MPVIFPQSSNHLIFFFLLLFSYGTWGLHSLPPTNCVQSDHYRITPCGIHCLNLFLDCYSLGGIPCFLFPWGVHLRAPHGILLWDILKICPSNRKRRFLNVVWICSEFVLACNFKFEMVRGQKIQQILRKHLLWNASILCQSTTLHHSDPYNSTDLTILL